MPVKLRLQRFGKKGKPFYHIVAADSRSHRDGKFIERVGSYNPNTNPATIDLNVDGSVKWLRNGAVPTDTVRSILSYKGVMMKHHLLKGVDKGALTTEQAEAKLEAWLSDKDNQIQAKRDGLASAKDAEAKQRFAAEEEARKKLEAKIAAKTAVEEEVVEEAATEEPTAEAPAEESTEEKAAE